MKATRVSQRRRLAPSTNQIIDLARESRKALVRVIDQASVRHVEEPIAAQNGDAPLTEPRLLTEEERIERLQIALAWLQKAEDINRQLRGVIERATAKEWRSL